MWSLNYLQYGIYAPILLATGWIIFDGCPLTHFQTGLNDEYFSQVLLEPIFPRITKEQTTRATYYILLAVTMIAFWCLC
jgi:hypothetical protein